jgi:mannose-1-phosphate guanylyltransferase/mannose-6-phosphate isomerase
MSPSKPILPVILSGGAGTRLWPLSRKQKPKQFIPLSEGQSPFEQTFKRVSDTTLFAPPLIICAKAHRFLVREILAEHPEVRAQIIMEPVARNTAPAIAIAAFKALENDDENALMLVIPSDHHIPAKNEFMSSVKTAAEAIQQGGFVLFGIKPTKPHVGYGYIEQGPYHMKTICKIKSFKEKPDKTTAQKYLETGQYSWNSGIFLLNAKTYLAELERFEPEIYKAAKAAWTNKTTDLGDTLLGEDDFAGAPSKSIDYAVMERTQEGLVLPSSFAWSDLGSWDSLAEIAISDKDQNVTHGDVITQGATNCYLHSEGPLLCASGVENIIAVAMNDVVLITQKGASEDVGQLVKLMEQKGRSEVTESRVVYRPWGSYETTSEGPGYKTKRIIVQPGKRLSLQSHSKRSEHWVVVSGQAHVTLDEKEIDLDCNQSIYVPCGSKHRLENKKSSPLIIIEVQTGDYLGEDDIERYDDDFGRNTGT